MIAIPPDRPAELFYVRSHSPAPELELASYRLQIDAL